MPNEGIPTRASSFAADDLLDDDDDENPCGRLALRLKMTALSLFFVADEANDVDNDDVEEALGETGVRGYCR